jgi:hypothetical protein
VALRDTFQGSLGSSQVCLAHSATQGVLVGAQQSIRLAGRQGSMRQDAPNKANVPVVRNEMAGSEARVLRHVTGASMDGAHQ